MQKGKTVAKVNISLTAAKDYGHDRTVRGVRGMTLEAENILVDVLSQPGSGDTYQIGGVVHQASAPGEAPAPNTGRLRNSRESDVFETPSGARGVLSVNAEYALPLEVGTERMAPRPFMEKVLKEGERLFAAFTRFARGV